MPSTYNQETKLFPTTNRPRNVGLLIIAIFFSIICFTDTNVNSQQKPMLRKELVRVKGTLLAKPVMRLGKYPSVSISLEQYPNIVFSISDWRLKALRSKQFVKESERGDAIIIEMPKQDFDIKIMNGNPVRWVDRFTNYSRIEPYYISVKEQVYMTLESVNSEFVEHKRGQNSISIFSIIAAISIASIAGFTYLVVRHTSLGPFLSKWFPID